jgi:uncharacterized protein (TIGR02466 family)
MPTEAIFPTPIYWAYVDESKLQDIQAGFLNAYADLKSKGKFRKKEGWAKHTHSLSDPSFKGNFIEQYNLTNFKKELHHHLKQFLTELGHDFPHDLENHYYIESSWMTETGKDEFAHTHSHGPADISGSYYVNTSGQDGQLVFISPNKLMESSFLFQQNNKSIFVKPAVGKIVLFPGWLEHGVSDNFTDNNRISVSFNIFMKRKDKNV